jgi:hypothetical protein
MGGSVPGNLPGKTRPGKILFLIVVGPGNFLLQPESGRTIFRFVPVTAGNISSDYIERPGIFSGCRELICGAVRAGFLLMVSGRTFGPD